MFSVTLSKLGTQKETLLSEVQFEQAVSFAEGFACARQMEPIIWEPSADAHPDFIAAPTWIVDRVDGTQTLRVELTSSL